MPEMIAKKLTRYAGKNLKPGDPFEVAEEDVRKLVVPGFAELAAKNLAAANLGASEENGYLTRAMSGVSGRKRVATK